MCFRLVPKSVALNVLERRNGHYFTLFRGIEYSLRGHVNFIHLLIQLFFYVYWVLSIVRRS